MILFLIGMQVSGVFAEKDWKHIPADHLAFHYSGRFDHSDPVAVRYEWPGTTISFSHTGNKLQLILEGGERNYFNLFVDNRLHEVIHLPGDTVYTVKGIKGKGRHVVQLQKRTEGEMGTAVFKGVNVSSKGEVFPVGDLPERKIEFIGNSITCGYGTEGASRDEDFLPSTENVNKSYALITARAFNAECVVTAHSGLGVVRNYGGKELPTLPDRFDQTLDEDSTLMWNFAKWQPNAVVINLGTNDFSAGGQPEKVVFQRGYETFIRKLRSVYGAVPIFCINGPMRDEPAYSYVKEVVGNCRIYYNDRNLYFIGIPTGLLNNTDDLGSDWHPSYKGQVKMAAHIVSTIANVLNWSYNNDEWKAL